MYEQTYKSRYYLALKYMGIKESAEDVLQDAYMSEVYSVNAYGRLEAPFYNGVLRIRENVLTGAPIAGQDYDTASKVVLMEDDWNYFNGGCL